MSENNFPEAVLWDMDGTLIDSEPYWVASEHRLAQDYGTTWSEQDAHELIGKSLYDSSELLRQKFGITDLSVVQVIDRLTSEVVSDLSQRLVWRPGALELLTDLKKAGIKTALVTMSMRRMAQSVVDQIPFHAFDAVVAGDEVVMGKPHPEPYLKAAVMLGVDPTKCIALEDSSTGLASAEAAGTLAVGIPNLIPLVPTANGVVIKSLTELTAANIGELRNRG
jgi:HAD superfamily hydrolase (TIGR01509 family)